MDLPMSTPPEPVDPKTTRPRIRTLRITMLEHAPTTLRSDPYYDTHTYYVSIFYVNCSFTRKLRINMIKCK